MPLDAELYRQMDAQRHFRNPGATRTYCGLVTGAEVWTTAHIANVACVQCKTVASNRMVSYKDIRAGLAQMHHDYNVISETWPNLQAFQHDVEQFIREAQWQSKS